MYNDTGIPLKALNVEEIKRILRDNGKFSFDAESGIDIDIFYYSDLEIATSDIHQLFHTLKDSGKEPIALILDYILKLDSDRDDNGEERLRLVNAGKELKTLAQVFDIPVITAMQFNRDGNSIIDAAIREEKENILDFVGPAMIGTAWGLIQECDFVCAINLERRRSTNSAHMSFKLMKIRGKRDAMQMDYFNHPFANNNSLRLEVDIDKPQIVSTVIAAADLESINEDDADTSFKKRNNGSAQARPKIANKGFKEEESPYDIVERIDMNTFRQIA